MEGGVQLAQLHGRPLQDRVHPPLTGSQSGGGSGHEDDWAVGWQVELLLQQLQLPGYNWAAGIEHLFQGWGGHRFLSQQLSQQLCLQFSQLLLQLLVQLPGEGDVSVVRGHDGGGGDEVQLLQQGDGGQV